MLASTTTVQQEYQALRSGAALQRRPNGGVLALADADRVDFLQRMTTNDVKALAGNAADGQSCVTVLTSPTAKIVQVFTVLARADDVLLLPALGAAEALARHLRGQIFFMDKVKVSDLSAQFARLRLMGPQALTALAATGLDYAAVPAKGSGAAATGCWSLPSANTTCRALKLSWRRNGRRRS